MRTRALAAAVVLAAGCARPGARVRPPAALAPQDSAVHPLRAAARVSPAPRFEGTVTLLADGRVLAAGGGDGALRTAIADADLYDPRARVWRAAAPMRHARHMASATRLADGRVLVAGGRRGEHEPVLEAELYDPRADRWIAAGSLRAARWAHRAVLLRDGRVLVAGGATGAPRNAASSEIYDPRTGAWTAAAPMSRPRASFALATLPGGAVLAAGGSQDERTTLAEAELYDPSANAWSPAPSMTSARYAAGALALADGRVLVAGGQDGTRFHDDAELYDPRAGAWRPAGRLSLARNLLALAPLGRGAIALGGRTAEADTDATDLFDAATLSWRPGPRLSAPAAHAAAVETPAGALLASGRSGGRPLERPELVRSGARRLAAAQPVAEAPPARPAPLRPPRPNDYALVVGVETYKGLPRADYAANDARAVAETLTALGVPEENVVILSDERATLANLAKYAEEWLAKGATADSRVWFYFSGHGAPDIAAKSPFLMPWDGDPAFVKSTGFPLERLYAALSALPAREVIAVLDACFTGSGDRSVLAPGLRPLVAVNQPATPPRLTVMTAASAEETAGALPEAGHGLFTHHLLEGLAGAADADGDGHATVEEVHRYARKRVLLDARKADREQTPGLTAPDPKLRLW